MNGVGACEGGAGGEERCGGFLDWGGRMGHVFFLVIGERWW